MIVIYGTKQPELIWYFLQIYENCHDEMNVDTAESLQSRALQVLFAIVHHSSRLEQEYINIGGHSLLAKVLTSCRSTVGYSILKVRSYKCPFWFINMHVFTVQGVYYDHPWESGNLVFVHRWSLFRVSVLVVHYMRAGHFKKDQVYRHK